MVSRDFLTSLFCKRTMLLYKEKKKTKQLSFYYLREIPHSELLSIFIKLSTKRKGKEALNIVRE